MVGHEEALVGAIVLSIGLQQQVWPDLNLPMLIGLHPHKQPFICRLALDDRHIIIHDGILPYSTMVDFYVVDAMFIVLLILEHFLQDVIVVLDGVEAGGKD